MVSKKIAYKEKNGSVTECELGAKAANVFYEDGQTAEQKDVSIQAHLSNPRSHIPERGYEGDVLGLAFGGEELVFRTWMFDPGPPYIVLYDLQNGSIGQLTQEDFAGKTLFLDGEFYCDFADDPDEVYIRMRYDNSIYLEHGFIDGGTPDIDGVCRVRGVNARLVDLKQSRAKWNTGIPVYHAEDTGKSLTVKQELGRNETRYGLEPIGNGQIGEQLRFVVSYENSNLPEQPTAENLVGKRFTANVHTSTKNYFVNAPIDQVEMRSGNQMLICVTRNDSTQTLTSNDSFSYAEIWYPVYVQKLIWAAPEVTREQLEQKMDKPSLEGIAGDVLVKKESAVVWDKPYQIYIQNKGFLKSSDKLIVEIPYGESALSFDVTQYKGGKSCWIPDRIVAYGFHESTDPEGYCFETTALSGESVQKGDRIYKSGYPVARIIKAKALNEAARTYAFDVDQYNELALDGLYQVVRSYGQLTAFYNDEIIKVLTEDGKQSATTIDYKNLGEVGNIKGIAVYAERNGIGYKKFLAAYKDSRNYVDVYDIGSGTRKACALNSGNYAISCVMKSGYLYTLMNTGIYKHNLYSLDQAAESVVPISFSKNPVHMFKTTHQDRDFMGFLFEDHHIAYYNAGWELWQSIQIDCDRIIQVQSGRWRDVVLFERDGRYYTATIRLAGNNEGEYTEYLITDSNGLPDLTEPQEICCNANTYVITRKDHTVVSYNNIMKVRYHLPYQNQFTFCYDFGEKTDLVGYNSNYRYEQKDIDKRIPLII